MGHVITCRHAEAVGGKFVINYDDGTLFMVNNLTSGSEAGVVLAQTVTYSPYRTDFITPTSISNLSNPATNDYRYYVSDGTLAWVQAFAIPFPPNPLLNTTDGGKIAHDLTIGTTASAWSYYWDAGDINDPAGRNTRHISSIDGGNSWFETTVTAQQPFRTTVTTSGVAPLHNNTQAYIWYNLHRISGGDGIAVNLANTSGGISTQNLNPTLSTPGFWGSLATRKQPTWSAVRPGYTDTIYFLGSQSTKSIWTYSWSGNSITYLGDLSAVAGDAHKMIATRTGALILVSSNPGTDVFNIIRSTDGFSTYSTYDAVAGGLVPTGRPTSAANDQIAIDYQNTLFIPIEAQNIGLQGFGLVSTDDGVTWSATTDFLYGGDGSTYISLPAINAGAGS